MAIRSDFRPATVFSNTKKGLGLVALAVTPSLLSVSPSVAAVPGQTTISLSEPVMIAGFFDDALKIIDVGIGVVNAFEERAQAQREEEARQLRELEAIRVQQEREAAKAAAAEQRRQYWESLTPEQQEAYIAEQREKERAQMDAVAGLLLGWMSSGADDGGSHDSGGDYILYPQQQRPRSQPVRRPTTPVGGNGGFYGNGW
ncbi:MAG: hypothetical protein AAGI45_15010 [Cyanobacteria bacterium P01_H01_bin.26]